MRGDLRGLPHLLTKMAGVDGGHYRIETDLRRDFRVHVKRLHRGAGVSEPRSRNQNRIIRHAARQARLQSPQQVAANVAADQPFASPRIPTALPKPSRHQCRVRQIRRRLPRTGGFRIPIRWGSTTSSCRPRKPVTIVTGMGWTPVGWTGLTPINDYLSVQDPSSVGPFNDVLPVFSARLKVSFSGLVTTHEEGIDDEEDEAH